MSMNPGLSRQVSPVSTTSQKILPRDGRHLCIHHNHGQTRRMFVTLSLVRLLLSLSRKNNKVEDDDTQAKSTITKKQTKNDLSVLPKHALYTAHQDLHVYMLTFLTDNDLRNLMQVNRHYYKLLHEGKPSVCGSIVGGDSGARYLWKRLVLQRWSFVKEHNLDQSVMTTTEASSLPWARVLSMGQDIVPETWDASLLCPDMVAVQSDQQVDDDMALRAVFFTGQVGLHNQCVRANHPLPRPKVAQSATSRMTRRQKRLHWRQRCRPRQKWQNHAQPHAARQDMDGAADNTTTTTTPWQPFVVPFCVTQHSYSFTPRTIAYFEVNLLHPNNQVLTIPSHTDHMASHGQSRRPRPPCIAVGLSLALFPLRKSMPGWGPYDSFGYHSDDGSTFACRNAMSTRTQNYGPTFGVGDVVGCGIDYRRQAVFYTLNGKFLGYEAHTLTKAQSQQDWYPTVGLDSREAMVECNFGTHQPFCFDLQAMVLNGHEQTP